MQTIEFIKQAFDLKNQGCYKQAIEMLYKALEIENDNIEIFFQLGELYFLLKNFTRAEHYLEKVLSKNENHIDALKILGKIYMYSDNLTKAFDNDEKILSIENSTQNILQLLEICSKQGNLEKAKEFENTDDDKILYGIAKAYYDNKKSEEAKTKLETLLKINPKNEDALVLLGKIYFDKGDFEKSKSIFNTFSKTSENPEILNYQGLFSLEEMNFTDAIKCFSKASNINKKNAKYFYNLGNAYFYNGWIKEAVGAYLQAIYIEPDNNGFRYSLAYLYYEIKNFDKAKSEVDYILKNNPEYSQAHVLNALLKLENKDFLGAKSELETNLKMGSNDNFTLISLAKVYKELLLYDKAENLIRQVISNMPDSENYQCKLAELLVLQKKFADAEQIIEKVIKQNENYIKAYIIGAKIALETENFDKAKEYAQNAISLDMNYAGGYFYLALVRLSEKDYDEAIECMKRAITYDIENPEYYAKMSEIYEAKQDFETALAYIKEAENICDSELYKTSYKRLFKLTKNLTKNKT